MLDAVNKLSKLLSAKQKRQALAVFGLMLLAAVFEFVSVGSVAAAGVGPVIETVGATVSTVQMRWSWVRSEFPA